jgi:hypothetical protein
MQSADLNHATPGGRRSAPPKQSFSRHRFPRPARSPILLDIDISGRYFCYNRIANMCSNIEQPRGVEISTDDFVINRRTHPGFWEKEGKV